MIALIQTLVAQVSESVSPIGLLLASNGALAVGLAALYRDCRKDRALLWEHVRQLERKLSHH